MPAASALDRLRGTGLGITAGLIGWFILVEFVSGIIQGYYVPLFSDIVIDLGIHDSDVNWFEAAQLLLSAIVVPILAKLGDMYGHKRLTAAASWWLVFAGDFWTFLIAWALQGFYVVWLPLEVALIFERGRRQNRGVSSTRRAAGLLVVGLQAGAIAGALAAGAIFEATGGDLTVTMMIPAIAVTLIAGVIWLGVPESEPTPGRRLDTWGFVLLTWGLLLVTGALVYMRMIPQLDLGENAWWWVVALFAAGIAVFVWFVKFELRQDDPAIDIRVLRRPEMWPVQTTAFLVGISLLGAQGPLSTYAGTDSSLGYGLGLSASQRSYVIGVYLLSLIIGAIIFAVLSRRANPRLILIGASLLVGIGYTLFLPFHLELWQVLLNLMIAGLPRTDRDRVGAHQHHQDCGRRLRVSRVRCAAGCRRRSSCQRDRSIPRRLSRRLGYLRRRRVPRGPAVAVRPEGGLRRHRYESTRRDPGQLPAHLTAHPSAAQSHMCAAIVRNCGT